MKKRWLIAALLLAALTGWLLWGNTALEVNTWVIENEKIPAAFDGFRIAQVSDLHNEPLNGDVAAALKALKPDLIVLTGDLVDSRRTDVDAALDFVREAAAIATCCYVPGNHEARISQWPLLRQGLLDAGVLVLEDEAISLEHNGDSIAVLGLRDPDFLADQDAVLSELTEWSECYRILLSHRPERLALYAQYGVDLVFSGHAHGGQIRLPIVGGLMAPHQGILPEYDSGLYHVGETAMLVSRGVGNSIFPLRVNNRPEIVVAELKVPVGIYD